MEPNILKFFRLNPDSSWTCKYPISLSLGNELKSFEPGQIVFHGDLLAVEIIRAAALRKHQGPSSLTELRHAVAEHTA